MIGFWNPSNHQKYFLQAGEALLVIKVWQSSFWDGELLVYSGEEGDQYPDNSSNGGEEEGSIERSAAAAGGLAGSSTKGLDQGGCCWN